MVYCRKSSSFFIPRIEEFMTNADADFCDSIDRYRLTNGLVEQLQVENIELKKHIKLLIEALKNYSDKQNYRGIGFWDGLSQPTILSDNGELARAALASLPEELRGL